VNQPVTAIDSRYSAEAAIATAWETTRDLLESAELFWISTVRADGRPHVTPVVAVWVEGALCFCTGEAEQKAINLRTNDQVILTTGANRWDTGLDVVVEGTARQVTDDDALERLAEAWTAKWDGRWRYEVQDGVFRHSGGTEAVLVFSVEPDQVLAFAKGAFSHTSHRF
jgi:nitroimidazol reductase NimA-like FMN-containing flavoprotein (pyridoxamine 5'-phosphate oxidase superfamily)